MAENDSFVFYLEWIDYLEMLPPNKAMEILKALVGLIRDEKTVQFTDPGQNMAYSFIANQVKRDKRKYKEVVSKRAEAGRKGGLAKQANARSAKQSLANLAVNVNDNDNVNVNDNDIIPPISPKGEHTDEKEQGEGLTVKMADGTGTPANRPKTLVEDRFNVFWKAYPRKEAKKTAFKAFQKLKPDSALLEKMLAALEWQAKSEAWKRDGGQYIPLPASWINGGRWEDEPKAADGGRKWKILE